MKIRHQLIDSREGAYSGTSRCTTITAHETANTAAGADAQAHANLQENNPRDASWHIQVDDKQAIRSYPDEVRCWHAGDDAADSIAVEICVNSDGDRKRARANAAEVIAQLCEKHGLDEMNVVGHTYWTGKTCPYYILTGDHWDSFIDDIRSHLDGDAGTSGTDSATSGTGSSGGSDGSDGGSSKPWAPGKGPWPDAYLTVKDEHNEWSHKAWVKLLTDVGYEVADENLTLALQRWLAQWPHLDVGPDDGVFGERTTRALQRFLKKRNHYEGYIDGDRGPMTIRGEFEYLNDQAELYHD